jgi:hypothetical protein
MILIHSKISSVSIGGVDYQADDEGRFEVPDGAANELIASFGFRELGGGVQNGRTIVQWKKEELVAEAERLGIAHEGLKHKELVAAIRGALEKEKEKATRATAQQSLQPPPEAAEAIVQAADMASQAFQAAGAPQAEAQDD